MIRFSFVVEMEFPRSQSEVFSFLEDPRSLVESGVAVRVTGSGGRRGTGELVCVGDTGREEFARFRVRRYRPPWRTVIEQESPPQDRAHFPGATMKSREESRYVTTEAGCRVIRTVDYTLLNVQALRDDAANLLSQVFKESAKHDLDRLREALLRRDDGLRRPKATEDQRDGGLPGRDRYSNG
jgi:hypothetical protein